MTTLFAKSARLLGALTLGVAFHMLAAPVVATDANAACVSGVARNDVLNIRSGPGASYGVVGFIRPGECGGARDRAPRGEMDLGRLWPGGFVNKRYLRSEDEGGDGDKAVMGAASAAIAGDPAFRCVIGVASNDMNVRSGAQRLERDRRTPPR